jgi:hypothetical protein
VILVEDTATNDTAGTPPIFTAVAPSKFVPVISIVLSYPNEDLENEVTDGATAGITEARLKLVLLMPCALLAVMV